jgi:IPT/TIG domain-containing protein
MRRRSISLCLAAASLMLLALVPPATAAKKKKLPTITKVSPMRVAVGAKLTIRGKNFSAKRKRNTVIFRGPSGRTAFAKPKRASRKKLVLRVPPAVARLLGVRAGRPRPTRIKLRVLAGRFGKYTKKRLSPVIVSTGGSGGLGLPPGKGDGGGTGSTGCPGSDYDKDLLTDAVEKQIGTDACLADTDGDTISDGYEQQSAIDLNHYPRTPPLPYPGKRPYPNALDPSDSGTDYDGDSLQLREEFLLWSLYSADGVRRSGRPTTLSNLLYSDGLQKSIDPPPFAPPAGTLARWAVDLDGDDRLYDDERDADSDALSNWDESHGRMLEAWWPAQHDGTNEPKESAYPEISFLDNPDLLHAGALDALADRDIDGDGVRDGADDADHDGLTNQFEVRRPDDWMSQAWVVDTDGNFTPGPNSWAYVNPFNPCKPFRSERCHRDVPFGYYQSDEAPPVGPDPPAGFPGGGPPTPAG